MIEDVGRALAGFFLAPRFAFRNRMGWIFLVPALLWVLFAVGLFSFSSWLVQELGEWWKGYLGVEEAVAPEGLWAQVKAFLRGTGMVVVLIVIKLAVFFLLALVNKYIVLIVLSPLLAYASELAEEKATGRSFPFSLPQLVKDTVRGILIALRNGLLELTINVTVWVGTVFVPVLAPFSVLFLFLVSAYFYGFSMFDYVLERRRMRVGESVRVLNENVGMVLANGALFSLLSKIPLVGMMFVPIMAAIGATLAWVEKEQATALSPRT